MPAANRVNVSDPERVVSAAGGGALFIYGLRRHDPAGIGLAALGAALFYRGLSRHCHVRQALAEEEPGLVSVQRAVTISKDPQEAFEYWRNLANLPRFMDHLQSVTIVDDRHAHWIAKGPSGKTLEWDTEIVRETKGRLIEWRSLSGSEVETSGSVRFSKRQNGRGTKVHLSFRYEPPANGLGTVISKFFGSSPERQVERELRKFKEVIEAS